MDNDHRATDANSWYHYLSFYYQGDARMLKVGNKLEDFVRSKEPRTRSAELLKDSAKRLRINTESLQQIIKPSSVHIKRLSVPMLGSVVNIMSGIVLHNRARGPFKGGIRIAKDVDLWETNELARLMTLKTALAGLQLGGGKSGISVDLRALRKLMVRAKRFNGTFREFTRIANIDIMAEFAAHFGWLFSSHEYIPAPDMGSGADEMVQIYNLTQDPASVTGKPEGIEGWLPGRKEATGYGVYYATLKYMEAVGRAPDQCTAVIQGFGKVGAWAASFLHEAGTKVIAVNDLSAGVHDPKGLDIPSLMEHFGKHGHVKGFKAASIDSDRLFQVPCDCLIPAACGHVIDEHNAPAIPAKVIVEAANMPVSYEGMQVLAERGVAILPDAYANAGGVIASDLEYRQALGGRPGSREQTLDYIRTTFDQMIDAMAPLMKRGRTMPEASTDIALERVYSTMRQRNQI